MALREARIQFEGRPDAFRLAHLDGTETLNHVYSADIEVLHSEHTIALPQIARSR
jgi:hypothetical protein